MGRRLHEIIPISSPCVDYIVCTNITDGPIYKYPIIIQLDFIIVRNSLISNSSRLLRISLDIKLDVSQESKLNWKIYLAVEAAERTMHDMYMFTYIAIE